MPYDTWHKQDPAGAPKAVQAFVFDGWSHEPLVIDRKQATEPVAQPDAPTVARSTASGGTTTRNPT